MKYIGTILAAYIVLFVLDIMQKRNHKTTKSLNNFSIRTIDVYKRQVSFYCCLFFTSSLKLHVVVILIPTYDK